MKGREGRSSKPEGDGADGGEEEEKRKKGRRL